MTNNDYAGIDYGMGQSNIDTDTGTRYGIISQHALAYWAIEEFESHYSAHCPNCGDALPDEFESPAPCPVCSADIGDGEQFGDDPDGWSYSDEFYELTLDSSGDVWIFKSPYITNAQFCSPCAPGAGHLENPCDNGPETYALGPEWFDADSPCPYAPRLSRRIMTKSQDTVWCAVRNYLLCATREQMKTELAISEQSTANQWRAHCIRAYIAECERDEG